MINDTVMEPDIIWLKCLHYVLQFVLTCNTAVGRESHAKIIETYTVGADKTKHIMKLKDGGGEIFFSLNASLSLGVVQHYLWQPSGDSKFKVIISKPVAHPLLPFMSF